MGASSGEVLASEGPGGIFLHKGLPLDNDTTNNYILYNSMKLYIDEVRAHEGFSFNMTYLSIYLSTYLSLSIYIYIYNYDSML